MMVSSCQGVCNVLLITAAVAAVLWLTVNGIANDTVNGCILLHKRNIVSSSAIPCRHGRCHPVRASIASINAVARTYEPLALYIEVGVIYLMFSTVLTWLQGRGEKRLNAYQKQEVK